MESQVELQHASQGKKKCNDFLPGAAFSNFFLQVSTFQLFLPNDLRNLHFQVKFSGILFPKCSDLLSEKNVLVIEKKMKFQIEG